MWKSTGNAGRRFLRVEFTCAVSSALLGFLTLIWRDWIEAVFHFSPDQRNGSFEWLIAAAFIAIAIVLGSDACKRRLEFAAAGPAPEPPRSNRPRR